MTHRVLPQPTLLEVALALREGVTWFVGQVSESRRVTEGSGWVNVGALFNSSASPHSSGTHTGKPLEPCTSERPEGEESRAGLNMI